MKYRISLVLLLLTVVALAAVRQATAAVPTVDGKIRVLILTGGHGFEPGPFFAMFDSFDDVTYDKAEYPDAGKLLEPGLAEKYDVLVFYDMCRGITPEQQKRFVALLNSGIGVVALHHTLGAHRDWPEYHRIIGGKFQLQERTVHGKTLPKSGWAHGQDIHVKVADPRHPITRGLKDFDIHDETYNNYDTDPNAHVLLTTDHPKNDPELAWVKTYGNSRVFYLMLGHDRTAYENPNYRRLVSQGIRWAASKR